MSFLPLFFGYENDLHSSLRAKKERDLRSLAIFPLLKTAHETIDELNTQLSGCNDLGKCAEKIEETKTKEGIFSHDKMVIEFRNYVAACRLFACS
jgi:hypothetical protein